MQHNSQVVVRQKRIIVDPKANNESTCEVWSNPQLNYPQHPALDWRVRYIIN